MKIKNSIIAAVFLSALVAAGCGKEDKSAAGGDVESTGPVTKPAEPPAPAKPIELDEALDIGASVTDEGETRYKGMKMTGPTGSSVEYSAMGITVKYGEVQFELRFEFDDEGAVAKGKVEAEKDELDPLVKFHVDTPEAILFESTSKLDPDGEHNHHFVATVKVGEKNLLCKNKGYGQFSKAQAEALLKTCQSAKVE